MNKILRYTLANTVLSDLDGILYGCHHSETIPEFFYQLNTCCSGGLISGSSNMRISFCAIIIENVFATDISSSFSFCAITSDASMRYGFKERIASMPGTHIQSSIHDLRTYLSGPLHYSHSL